MNNQFNSPQTVLSENVFSEYFNAYEESNQFKRLKTKFTPLPYFKKYKSLRQVSLVSSYLFNLFSGLTASTLVFFFVACLSHSWIIAGIVTASFLFLLELSKRKINSLFFRDWLQYRKISLGLLSVLLLLVSLSVSFSYFGSKKLVTEFTPPPVLLNTDSTTGNIQKQIAAIDTQIQAARQTKWKGTTTTKSQNTINNLTAQKTDLLSDKIRRETRADAANDTTTARHNERKKMKAEYFAMVTLLLELLFLLSAFYPEYYDYRSFIEYSQIMNITNKTNANFAYTMDNKQSQIIEPPHDDKITKSQKAKELQKPITRTNTSQDAILKAMKHVKGRIASAKHRIRNKIGRLDTSQKNVEKHTAELQQLETLLNKGI